MSCIVKHALQLLQVYYSTITGVQIYTIQCHNN